MLAICLKKAYVLHADLEMSIFSEAVVYHVFLEAREARWILSVLSAIPLRNRRFKDANHALEAPFGPRDHCLATIVQLVSKAIYIINFAKRVLLEQRARLFRRNAKFVQKDLCLMQCKQNA